MFTNSSDYEFFSAAASLSEVSVEFVSHSASPR
jgi:hypothetical protein